MNELQVQNVPDELQERLVRHARKRKRTMSDVILEALESEIEQI